MLFDLDFRDFDLRSGLDFIFCIAYPISLKPFVCLNIFRFTLFIFFLELLRPRELATEVAECADLADFDNDLRERTDLTLWIDLLFDLDRLEPGRLLLL